MRKIWKKIPEKRGNAAKRTNRLLKKKPKAGYGNRARLQTPREFFRNLLTGTAQLPTKHEVDDCAMTVFGIAHVVQSLVTQ